MQVDITKEVLQIIRNFVDKNDISISEFGRRSEVSKAWISKLQHTESNLSLETAQNLLEEAGYTLKIVKKETTGNSTSSRLKRIAKCQNI